MSIDLEHQHFFAIVPAAGVGSRMCADQPKQYLTLNGKSILEHAITKLLSEKKLQYIVVPVSANDTAWRTLDILKDKRIRIIDGGDTRAQSVLNALEYLSTLCCDNDWVLVHDAARPCITLFDLQLLMTQLRDDKVGGILAVPTIDTIKKVDTNHVIVETVDRSVLWHAQTPQMFRYRLLFDALKYAINQGFTVTDEASAIELAGGTPKVVEGSRGNIKITRPEDLLLAAFYMQQHE